MHYHVEVNVLIRVIKKALLDIFEKIHSVLLATDMFVPSRLDLLLRC
jgi:hypothetical protein